MEHGTSRALALLSCLALCVPLLGCAPSGDAGESAQAASGTGADTPQPERSGAAVLAGVDVLLRDSLALVRGRRVGLVTNHTGVSSAPAPDEPGRSATTVELLHAHPDVDLVALYTPEHGLSGAAEAGEKIESGRDPGTDLPIYSLYGETREPLPHMLDGVDVLLFDIQDVGTRYYTYVWTMTLAMRAAGAAGIPFVVLDRPNPIGGEQVQGNVLDTAFASFIGLHPVPMRHGMTVGEVARLARAEWGIAADLRVVPMDGWRRELWFEATGLAWIPPSPNMPSLDSATHYPGTCLFEGTNLSVGRGTERPFQWIGAPWLDGPLLAERLNARGVPGVRFEPATFTPRRPGDAKWADAEVHGVRFVVTDRAAYDPTRAAVAALVEARRMSGDRWAWRAEHFDRLAGTDRLRLAIEAGEDVDAVVAPWAAQLEAFRVLRGAHLLYP